MAGLRVEAFRVEAFRVEAVNGSLVEVDMIDGSSRSSSCTDIKVKDKLQTITNIFINNC